jgi:hypothetical protein
METVQKNKSGLQNQRAFVGDKEKDFPRSVLYQLL